MRIFSQLCLCIVFLFGAVNYADACCLFISHKKEIKKTEMIFSVLVTDVVEDKDYVAAVSDPGKRFFVKLKVEKIFKGTVESEITISQYEMQQRLSCEGIKFNKGSRYLIYASRREGQLDTGSCCGRTRALDENSKEYKELLKVAKNKRK